LRASRADTLEVPSLTMAKGKDKVPTTRPLPYPLQTALTQGDPVAGTSPQAWWLDVASPSWEDMKTLGRVSSSSFLLLTVELTRGAVATSSPSHP